MSVKYGELVVIGSENAELASKLKKHRFELSRPEQATAIMPSRTETLKKAQAREKLQSENNKAIMSYEFDENDVIISFTNVDDRDMFQIGRAMNPKNDVQLTDMPTVSRYACRIVVDRSHPHTARIYAGAFDDKSRIFLGQNAMKAEVNGQYEALITNGILLLNPEGGMASAANNDQWQPQWREVSVTGKLFKCKQRRAKPNMLEDGVPDESNTLVDGSIIDLGGVLLLWRSFEACQNFDDEKLQRNVAQLNKEHIQCPVQLQTLIIKRRTNLAQVAPEITVSDPYAFKLCGHVMSTGVVGQIDKCPMCRCDDPDNELIRLQLALESRVYVDDAPPTWFFKPCGHIATEKTAKYWSKVTVRGNGVDVGHACPFCLTPLSATPPVGPLYFASNER